MFYFIFAFVLLADTHTIFARQLLNYISCFAFISKTFYASSTTNILRAHLAFVFVYATIYIYIYIFLCIIISSHLSWPWGAIYLCQLLHYCVWNRVTYTPSVHGVCRLSFVVSCCARRKVDSRILSTSENENKSQWNCT